MMCLLNTRRSGLALAAVLAVLATACGSSDKSSSAPPPPAGEVAVTSLRIQVAKTSIAKGQELTLHATAVYSDNTSKDVSALASWGTSSEAVYVQMEPYANGEGCYAIGKAKGTALVSANFGGKSATQQINVTDAVVTAIAVAPIKDSPLPFALHKQVTAMATFSDGTTGDVTKSAGWTTSDSTLATVSAGIVATLNPGGPVTVTATDAASGVSGSTSFSVSAATLQSFSIAPENPDAIVKGAAQQFTATGVYSDNSKHDLTNDVTWKSDNAAVATVSAGGLATAILPGTAKISAKEARTGYATSVPLTVSGTTLAGILISGPVDAKGGEQTSVALGYTLQLSAKGVLNPATSFPDVTSFVKWSVADETKAIVSAGGLVTPKVAGTVVITATDPTNSATVQTKSITITEAKLLSLNLQAPATVPVGYDAQFKASGAFSDKTTKDVTTDVVWSLDDDSISNGTATIDPATGKLFGNKPGKVTVTATSGEIESSVQFTIADWTLDAIAVTPGSNTLAVGYPSVQLKVMGKYVDAQGAAAAEYDFTDKVGFYPEDEEVVAVDAKGLVTAVGAGTTKVHATYLELKSALASFTVTKAFLQELHVTPGTASLYAGQSLQFKATGTFSDGAVVDLTSSVEWTRSDEMPFSKPGLAVTSAAGNVTVTATQGDFYDGAKLSVAPVAVVKFTRFEVPSSLTVGTPALIQVFGELSDNPKPGTEQNISGFVSWTCTDLAAFSDADAVTHEVTPLKAGTFTIIVSDPKVPSIFLTKMVVVSAP